MVATKLDRSYYLWVLAQTESRKYLFFKHAIFPLDLPKQCSKHFSHVDVAFGAALNKRRASCVSKGLTFFVLHLKKKHESYEIVMWVL